MAGKREVFNCETCGRDTTAKDRICMRCRPRVGPFGGSKEETIGRKISPVPFSDCPQLPDDEDTRPDSATDYHGDVFRDDV